MATITAPTVLRHVRKTIAFDGGANNGNAGDEVTVFACTGRVILTDLRAFCTETLVWAGAGNIAIQAAGGWDIGNNTVLDNLAGLAAGSWWNFPAGEGQEATAHSIYSTGTAPRATQSLSDDVVIGVFTNDVTDGTLVIDAWYLPITDDGKLTGDDADREPQRQGRSGTAQAGGASTITLDSGASAVDDAYNNMVIVLLEGTGTSGIGVPERTRIVSDYVGSTKVATVDRAWDTAPSTDTVFLIFEAGT